MYLILLNIHDMQSHYRGLGMQNVHWNYAVEHEPPHRGTLHLLALQICLFWNYRFSLFVVLYGKHTMFRLAKKTYHVWSFFWNGLLLTISCPLYRFEMPFNIWCGGCNSMIGKGVRFNAEKQQVGNYYSTKVKYYLSIQCGAIEATSLWSSIFYLYLLRWHI